MDTKFSKAASGLAPFHSHYGSAGGKVEGWRRKPLCQNDRDIRLSLL